jgi:hypothetical protein
MSISASMFAPQCNSAIVCRYSQSNHRAIEILHDSIS